MPDLLSRRGACALMALMGVFSLLAVISGCEHADQKTELSQQAGLVVVSIPPLAGLVAPLLPPDCEVRVLVSPGRSAHGYQPTPEDIAAIGRADLIVLVGLNLETGITRAVRDKAVVRMADLVGVTDDQHAGHDHSGHDHSHDHGSVDPHLWLDPVLAAKFVRSFAAELPASLVSDSTDSEAATLAAQIDAIGNEYADRLAPFAGSAIVTHHASFNRPAERYGLEVAAVLRAVETLEPSPADIAAARKAIEDRGVGAIFVEPQFGVNSATRVAESADVALVTLDPLGDGDWIGLMRTNLDALVGGLSSGAPASPTTLP